MGKSTRNLKTAFGYCCARTCFFKILDSLLSSLVNYVLLFEYVISQLYLNYSIFPSLSLELTHLTIFIQVRKTTNMNEYQTNKKKLALSVWAILCIGRPCYNNCIFIFVGNTDYGAVFCAYSKARVPKLSTQILGLFLEFNFYTQ